MAENAEYCDEQKGQHVDYLEKILECAADSENLLNLSKNEAPSLKDMVSAISEPLLYSIALEYDLKNSRVRGACSMLDVLHTNNKMKGDTTPLETAGPVKYYDADTGAVTIDPINGSKICKGNELPSVYAVGLKLKIDSKIKNLKPIGFNAGKNNFVSEKVKRCLFMDYANEEIIETTLLILKDNTEILEKARNDDATAPSSLDNMLDGSQSEYGPMKEFYIIDKGKKTVRPVTGELYEKVLDEIGEELSTTASSELIKFDAKNIEVYFNGKQVKYSDFLLDKARDKSMEGRHMILHLLQLSEVKNDKICYPSTIDGKTVYSTESIDDFLTKLKPLFYEDEKDFNSLRKKLKSSKYEYDPSVS